MKFKKNAVFWYHLVIILLYVILMPLIFIFAKWAINYTFNYDHFLGSILIFCFAIFGFFYFFRRKLILNKKNFKGYNFLLIIVYALIMGFSEEIIFRGLIQGFIQGFIQGYFSNILVPILISSLIFGLAHLLNGAKNFHPRGWNWKIARITFLAGLFLGALFALTGSLLLPSILHTFFILGLYSFKE